MTHTTTCRYCKRSIDVEIDDDYASLGRPFAFILNLAACNRCYDLRVERGRLEEKIQRSCLFLEFLGETDAKQRAILRNILVSLARKYGRLISKWNQAESDFYQADLAAKLAEDPANWADHLNEYWRVFPEWKKSQPQTALPYKDD